MRFLPAHKTRAISHTCGNPPTYYVLKYVEALGRWRCTGMWKDRRVTTCHGTEASYNHELCRCAACTEAASTARRGRRRREAEATGDVCQFCGYPTTHPSHTCPAHRDLAPPIPGLDEPYPDDLHSSDDAGG